MTVYGSTIIEQVTEGLLLYNRTSTPATLELRLATSHTWVNSTIWEFTLRENVTFHDGTPFNATAVKWNIERIINMNINHTGQLKDFLEVNTKDYKSAYDHLDWAPVGSKILRINQTIILDPYTVQIVFNIPKSANEIIPIPTFNMISPTAHKDQFNEIIGTDKLVGTGPFIFTKIDYAGNEIIFPSNKNYWGGAPYITRLVYQDISNPQTLMGGVFEENIDFATVPDTSYLESIDNNLDLDLIPGELEFFYRMYVLNTQLIELEVRKAMSYAFDYKFCLEQLDKNYTSQALSIIYPRNKYYNASIGIPYYNLTYAREILIEAGISDLVESANAWNDQDWKDKADSDTPVGDFTFLIYNYDYSDGYFELFRENMKLIGIKIVDQFDGEAAYNDIMTDVERRKTEFDVAYRGWGCPLADPTDGWFTLTYKTDGTNNWPSVSDTEIDQWIDEAANELDTDKTQEIVNKICNKIQNELFSNILVSHPRSYLVINAKWEGVKIPYYSPLFYFVREKQASNTDTSDSPPITIGGFPFVEFNSVVVMALSITLYKKSQNKNRKME
jgi:peptide/nickel transport system substrate-binding protein